jgi:hypothetical protein
MSSVSQWVMFTIVFFRSKSKVHKLGFLWGSIATNDGLILLTIEGK